MRAAIFILVLSSAGVATADGGDARGGDGRSVGVAITLSGGLGWVDMNQFSRGAETYFTQLEDQVEGFSRQGSAESQLGMGLALRSQVRLPRFVTLEVGLEVLRHRKTTAIRIGASSGEIGYSNTSILVPFALGVHVPVADRVAVSAAAGPVLAVRSSSRWNYSLGQVTSFDGSLGGGFEAGAGAELDVVGPLRVALQVRYRFVKSGELSADGPELPPLAPVAELSWKGVTSEVGLRVVF